MMGAGLSACVATMLLSAGSAMAAGFDPAAAIDAYLATVAGEARAKSDAYFEGGYWMLLWSTLWTVGACWLLLAGGRCARLWAWAQGRVRNRTMATFLFGLGFNAGLTLLSFPWTIYADFVREHQYGMATQGFVEWGIEQLIASVITIIAFSILLTAIYAVIRATPRYWWVWSSGVIIGFLTIAIVITPVFLAPIFNDYKPLADGPIRDRILSMARANGVPADEVYQFDASRQTTRISANVSGMFGSMRISLNDNLLTRGTPEEVTAVMAHELGHYVLGHGYDRLMKYALLILFSLYIVQWVFPRVTRSTGTNWRITGVDDPAGAPLLTALLTLVLFLMTPVNNSIIRGNESEADIFGLNAAREPDAFATVALKIAEYRKLDPSPLEEIIFHTHPSGRTRITMAMRWKTEQIAAAEKAASKAADTAPAGAVRP